MRKLILIALLLITFTAEAVTIYPVPKDQGFLGKTFDKVIQCKLNIKCYFRQNLGVTITTINATDRISDSRAVINTNFSNLNNGKIENSTTSVASITTLLNLVSIGTITTGTWNGTGIDVARQGTGTTSPTSNQVILGNGSNGFKVVNGFGSTNQFLTSNGDATAPSWSTPAVNQTIDYRWTGYHSFRGGFSTEASASTTASLSIAGGFNFSTTSTVASSSVPIFDGNGKLKYFGFPSVDMGNSQQPVGTTGNQVINHNLGRIPYFIEINATSKGRFLQGGNSYCGSLTSTGYATSTAGTSQYSVFGGVALFGPGTDQIVFASTSPDRIIYIPDNGAESMVEASAQLTALTSTTFTLNWDVNDAAAGCVVASDGRSFVWKVY